MAHTLTEIPRPHPDLVEVTIRIFDVAWFRPFRQAAGIEGGTSVMEFVAPAMRYRKRHVAIADVGQFRRQVGEPPRHQMHHLAFTLDAALHPDHAGGQDDAALPLEHLRPDHKVGDAGLVLDGDERHALGRPRHLPHQHETGGPSSQRPSRAAVASAQVTMRRRRRSSRRNDSGWPSRVSPTWP